MFSVAYFLCFVVSIFSFAPYRGTCEIVPPLKNFALLYCLLAMGIELSTLVLAAIFKVDYKKALYAAVVFSKASPSFLTALGLLAASFTCLPSCCGHAAHRNRTIQCSPSRCGDRRTSHNCSIRNPVARL